MSGEVKRGGGILGRLDDVKLVWKAAVALAFLVAGMVAVVWVARDGFKTQKYHMSNIYEFMLIPIADLGSGEVAAGDIALALERIKAGDSSAETAKLAQDAVTTLTGVVNRYNTEWVTTASPQFTQTLNDIGRLDLQQKELGILEALNAAIKQSEADLKPIVAGGNSVESVVAAQKSLSSVRSTLSDLVGVNSEFAAESFTEANRANSSAKRLMWIALAVSLAAGLLLAGLLIVTTVQRLRRLTLAASRMRDGDLTGASGVVGRDEVGTVGQALDAAMVGLRESSERDRAEMARTAAVAGVVSEVSGFAQRLAQGDLTVRLSDAEQADLTRMVRDLNAMVSGLSSLSTQVRTVSSELNRSSQQILSAVTQHTAATNEQAASISESAATAEELRATAEQASRRADDVAERARRALAVSDEGLDALDDLVSAIGVIGTRVGQISSDILALSDHTQQIDAITQTVSDIADQSNMLALNATIEAAKAGEQGRGFAVVADEVRRLSEQSKVATEQVREILRQISDGTTAAVRATEEGTAAVETGARRLTRASTALEQLRVTVVDTSEAAGAIGASVREQNVGMNQIATALDDVAKTTNQMSAGAEQVLREAQRLAGLARQLDEATASYRVDAADA